MAAYIERRRSAAAVWSRRFAAFAAMMLFIATIGHRFGQISTLDFAAVLVPVLAFALLALLCAAWGFWRLWSRGYKAGMDSTRGAILALIVLAPFVGGAVLALRYPMLSDISTDPLDPPPLSVAATERGPQDNAIAPYTPAHVAAQQAAYPQVTGRRYEAAPDRIVELVLAEIKARGWSVRRQPPPPAVDPEAEQAPASERAVEPVVQPETIIEAVALTPILHFASDVSIRITDEGATTYVDMRSASRFGRHDLGDNARRIAGFLTALDAAVKGQPLDQAEEAEPSR